MKNNPKLSSPLRYPGGKSGLFNQVRKILLDNQIVNYIEPYAGGAGLALSLLYKECVDHITINDFDPHIYSFWKSVLEMNDLFIDKLKTIDLSIQEWKNQKKIMEDPNSSLLDLGFATFYLNRCNRSGILLGSGPIGGFDQSGKWKIDARFNRTNLIRRIEKVGEYSGRITLYNSDAVDLIKNQIPKKELDKSLVYFDPPYYKKGKFLYLNAYSSDDHEELRDLLSENTIQKWILTYDNVEEIRELYRSFESIPFTLLYSAANVRTEGNELFIYPETIQIDTSSIQHL